MTTILTVKPNEQWQNTLLTLVIGPSNGGKDHYLHTQYPQHIFQCVLSEDYFRYLLCGHFRNFDREPDVRSAMLQVLQARLASGVPTIINAQNISRRDRKVWLNKLPEGIMADYIIVDRPLEIKLDMAAHRDLDFIKQQHQEFADELPDLLHKDHDPRVNNLLDTREKEVADLGASIVYP